MSQFTTVEGDYRLFLARCNDGVPTVVFLGSMMPSRSLCLSESFAQSESLNVKTSLPTDLFAPYNLNYHHSKITSQIPQDCFDVFHIPSTCSSKTRRGIFSSHNAGPFCRSTVVCQPTVDGLDAQIVAVLPSSFSRCSQRNSVELLITVMFYSSSKISTHS